MKVVIINGIGGSGKDTFVKFCQELLDAKADIYPRCLNVSTVDYVKEIAAYCGWNGEKDPASRKFLSDLKKAMAEWRDLPVQDVKNKLDTYSVATQWYDIKDCVAFVHCREPKEIERLVEELDATTLLIRREAAENIQQINDSDNNVLHYAYDYTIYNNGDLNWLKDEAKIYLTNYLKLDI